MANKSKILVAMFASTIITSLCAVSDAAEPVTTFSFGMSIGDTFTSITSFGNPLGLPSALHNWSCEVTLRHVSDNGKSWYHNIVCSRGDLVVGTTISCLRNTSDFDSSVFFLRGENIRGKNVEVGFIGRCHTRMPGDASL